MGFDSGVSSADGSAAGESGVGDCPGLSAAAVADRLRLRRRERERREGLGVSLEWAGAGVGSAGSRPSLARMLRTTRPGLRPSVRTRTLATSR
ncbi:hypothetical protein [Nocardia wallacei]|uniref:hypothetical protein n=1 Tax=Nocardia wallacei TaxID=480035 RepID=UPI002457DD26|nr:hypothetical protein [Nocardia wallacei]